jgi:sulfopyruvate decarboxylase TPP-binding subunit
MIAARALERGKVIYDALKRSGVEVVLYLPDSGTYPIQKLAEDDPEMRTFCCAREDEAVAIAGGIAFAGGLAAVVMDSSGVGWSAYIMAECQQYRVPIVLVSSHSEALGEAHDHHNVARVMGEAIYQAVRVPYTVVTRLEDAATIVEQSIITARGQKMPVGIVLPPYIMGT